MGLFGTAGIRGSVPDVISPEVSLAVGRSVGLEARTDDCEHVVLGRDGRVTGTALSAAAEAGLLSAGVAVRRVGVVPTPALAFASRGRYGMMLTASHNPPIDNGIKLFVDGVEFDNDAEGRIEARVDADPTPAEWRDWRTSESLDVLEPYRKDVVEYVEELIDAAVDLRIAVDCGNGTGALATPQVLDALGADVTALQANIDGFFPARDSKPTPETLTEFCEYVAEGDYDLAFAHDGDADRIVVIDSGGSIVHEDTVLAVLAERYVRLSDASTPLVITTPNASARIDERVSASGGRTSRVALGELHVGITDARARGEPIAFAAEPWKHIHPDFGGWIDGIVSAAFFAGLVAESGGVAPLTEPVSEPPYWKDEVSCPEARKPEVMEAVKRQLAERFQDADIDTEHGVRVQWRDGSWVLVRPSGTEPVIRIYAEGDAVSKLMEVARDVVKGATE